MARRARHEEHENHERWLISYADFITLLFAFFVVMYSLSSVNEGKFRVLAEALAATFHGAPRSLTPIAVGSPMPPAYAGTPEPAYPKGPPAAVPQPVTTPGLPIRLLATQAETPAPGAAADATDQDGQERDAAHRAQAAAGGGAPEGALDATMAAIARGIEQAMGELIEQGMVRVRRFRFWLEIEINTSILFPSGSAELEADAVPALTAVAAVLRQYRNPVRIEGFTDNVPISTYLFPSNWELSSARAHTVLHLLVREGIAPERLAGVGHGEFKPVASNETPDGRRQNRRVVIVVLADEELEHLRETLLDPAGRTTTGGVDGNGAAAAHGPGAEPGSATAEAPAGGAADG